MRPELAVHLSPGEAQWSAEGEGAVGEPQVEIEAQGAALERREGVHVERDGVADDLVEEWLAQVDFAIPQRARGSPSAPLRCTPRPGSGGAGCHRGVWFPRLNTCPA